MYEDEVDEILWHCPDPRAIFILEQVQFDKKVVKKINKGLFNFTINNNFDFVIRQCANREITWINEDIIECYNQLNEMGFAHSIEVWNNNNIVGGLYGVAIGGAFFGESMFNTVTDAAKAAFYFLINHLKSHKFKLLDSQYINKFTEQLGAVEIPNNEYMLLLRKALKLERIFYLKIN